MGIAGVCGLFLLGNYGVQGDFSNDAEEGFFFSVMIAGGASLLVTAIWQGLVIRGEIRRDKENAAAGVSDEPGPSQEGAQAQQDSPVTELATFRDKRIFIGDTFGELDAGSRLFVTHILRGDRKGL